jgi:hypothetical protein
MVEVCGDVGEVVGDLELFDGGMGVGYIVVEVFSLLLVDSVSM